MLGGIRRTGLDVALHAANALFLLRALLAPELTPALLVPKLILIPLLGVMDKTVFLAARGEHYYVALLCLVVASGDALWISACKVIWCAIWFWAATSRNGSSEGSSLAIRTTSARRASRRGWRTPVRIWNSSSRRRPGGARCSACPRACRCASDLSRPRRPGLGGVGNARASGEPRSIRCVASRSVAFRRTPDPAASRSYAMGSAMRSE